MLHLVAGLTKNPRLEPLMDGTVKPRNIDLEFVVTSPPELFFRNLKYDEFDMFEMSIAEYLMTRERRKEARWQWSALPVFPAKAFIWLDLFVNTNAGIHRLDDLKGKRVGVPDYVMTAALWFRIFLKELCGIKPREIFWHIGRVEQFSHTTLLGLDETSSPGVSMNWLNEEQTFDVMLDRGELDAAYGFLPRHDPKILKFGGLDRYGGTQVEGNPRLHRLFSDGGREIIREYYQRTKVLPASHMIVVQDRILKQHPWVALELYTAFGKAKKIAYDRGGKRNPAYLLFQGGDDRCQAAVFGEDPYPFGIRENKKMLEILFRNSREDGLTQKLARVEDIFYHTTLDT